jgi:hypothetical protein
MSFRRGVMAGPFRIFCTECYLKGYLARRQYMPAKDYFRCPRCFSCLLRAHIQWGRR